MLHCPRAVDSQQRHGATLHLFRNADEAVSVDTKRHPHSPYVKAILRGNQ